MPSSFRAAAFSLFALAMLSPHVAVAQQDCSLRFAVVYSEGKQMQVGLTADQRKFWEREASHFNRLCLDPQHPDFVIVWSQSIVDQFDRAPSQLNASAKPAAKPELNSLDWREWLLWLQSESLPDETNGHSPSQVLREKAEFWIFDVRRSPSPVVYKGEGSREVPQGTAKPNQTNAKLQAPVTVADPTIAMENALKWLRKLPKPE